MTIPLEQAGLDALCAWLTSQLGSDVTVWDTWPDPTTQLPPKAVSVLLAGAATPIDVSTAVDSRVNIAGGNNATYTWIGGYREQALQLDVWTTNDPDRKDLCNRLDAAINAGFHGLGQTVCDPQTGVVVRMAAPYTAHTADVLFDGPSYDDNPDSIQRAEYRATFRGTMTAPFLLTGIAPRFQSATIVNV